MELFNPKLKILSWTLISFLFLTTSELFSQYSSPQLITSSGNFNISHSGSISWSLGEVATATLMTNDLIVTQGFQQPSISIIDQIKTFHPNLQINAYPNPTTNNITIEWNSLGFENYSIVVLDMRGIMLKQFTITPYQLSQTIDLTNINSGLYVLQVMNSKNQVIYTSLISKIN